MRLPSSTAVIPLSWRQPGEKPLSIAVEELNQEKIRILADNEPDEEDEAEPAEEDEVFEEETAEEYSEGDDVTE